jgi:hypothetical protein
MHMNKAINCGRKDEVEICPLKMPDLP